jgi:hypothetical protein
VGCYKTCVIEMNIRHALYTNTNSRKNSEESKLMALPPGDTLYPLFKDEILRRYG